MNALRRFIGEFSWATLEVVGAVVVVVTSMLLIPGCLLFVGGAL